MRASVMSEKDIEISPKGLKSSYLRFVADGVPGYVMVLLALAAYYNKVPMPLIGNGWVGMVPQNLGSEAKIFAFFLVFILATPIGLVINSLGWYFLAVFHIKALAICFMLPRWLSWPLLSTRRAFLAESVFDFFSISANGGFSVAAYRLYELARFYEEMLRFFVPNFHSILGPTKALKRLFRSFSVIALGIMCHAVLTGSGLGTAVVLLVLAMVFIALASLAEYYESVEILFRVYLFCYEIRDENPGRERIMGELLRISGRKAAT